MPIGPKRLPFFEHIAELRSRLVVIILTILVAASVLYGFVDPILEWLLKPVVQTLPAGKLSTFGPFELFTFRFKVALFAAIVVSAPVVIWQVLAFFLPALKPKERKWFVPTVFVGILLFAAGVFFCYEVILGPAFQWISGQAGEYVSQIPAADKYLSGLTLFLVGFGIAFELPLVVFYLVGLGVIPYRKARENWRYVYVGLMIIASAATPDWSPITMGALYGSLVGLYEISLFLVRVLFAKRIREQEELAAMAEA